MTDRQPGEPLARTSQDLVAAATARIETLPLIEAAALLGRDDVAFVDLRDPREVAREGSIPGSVKVPRGMLEFWVDPESPYYSRRLDDGRRLVLFCAAGWRSALATATLVDMGRTDVAHIEGGFTAWRDAGHPVEER